MVGVSTSRTIMNDLGFLVEKHSIEIKKSLEKLGKIALD